MRRTYALLFSIFSVFALMATLFSIMAAPYQTRAASNAAATPFEATFIQCNGVTIPANSNAPSWYPQGGTQQLSSTLLTAKNTTDPTYKPGSNSLPAQNVYNSSAPSSCNNAPLAAKTQSNSTIQAAWDVSRYFAQPLRDGLTQKTIQLTSCNISAFIPAGATAQSVRYDFWTTYNSFDKNDVLDDTKYQIPPPGPPENFQWLAWPGQPLPQNTATPNQWMPVGSVQLPTNSTNGTPISLIVTLNDQDTQAGLVVAAAAMKFDCTFTVSNGTSSTLAFVPSPCANGALASPPWKDQDIGNFTPHGKAVCQGNNVQGNTIVITGAGTSIGGAQDQFHYVFQQVSGDVTIVAHLASLQQSSGGPSFGQPTDVVGVMIRQDTTGGAANAMVFENSAGGTASLQVRSAAQGQTTATQAPTSSGITSQPSTPWMKLQRKGDTFTGWVSTDGKNWGTPINAVTITMQGPVLVGLAVTPINSNNASTDTATFDNITVTTSTATSTPAATPSPGTTTNLVASPCANGALASPPWKDQDIGNFTPHGKAVCQGNNVQGNTIVITGAGTAIGGAQDQFHYVFESVSGDVTIVAHLASLQQASGGPSFGQPTDVVGVMIRQDTTGGAANAMVFENSAGGTASLQVRSAAQGQTTATQAPTSSGITSQPSTPWMKLQRKGDTFTGWVSTDGKNWGTPINAVTITMQGPVLVGLAVTPINSNNASTDTATFDNITVTTP